MLRKLEIKNGIKHGLYGSSSVYSFEGGLTTITGANESGKSLIIEFIRYALFGTKALRGKATDYKGLEVTLQFVVKGSEYRVIRTKSNTSLSRREGDTFEPIASGTSPVNSKVIEIFGYDLTVFDIAHNVQQGQIEALGSMRPSERKAMVDQTIGLNVLDTMIEDMKQKTKIMKERVEAVEQTIATPHEPDMPEDLRSSEDVLHDLTEARQNVDQIKDILRKMQNSIPEPRKPECPVSDDVQKLEEYQAERQRLVQLRNELERKLSNIPETTKTYQELDEAEKRLTEWVKYQEWLRIVKKTGPKPEYNTMELTYYESLIKQWVGYERLSDLWHDNHIECPECGHEWSTKLEYKPEPPAARRPDISLAEIKEQMARHDAWKNGPDEWVGPVPGDEGLMSESEIRLHRKALERASEREAIATQLNNLVIPPDRHKDLDARRRYEVELSQYNLLFTGWTEWEDERVVLEEELDKLRQGDPERQVSLLEKELEEVKRYQWEKEQYEKAFIEYQRVVETLSKQKEQMEEHKNATKALVELKTRIKLYLTPALSKVASILINKMTGGQRTRIEIDEDFNILVDGLDLNLLSGSGQAVANLAIRIGLGQVLTNGVFSVFIGDELDAAMDVERAGYTTETLRGLTNKIGQVILVTHKQHDVDHEIKLAV